LDPDERAELVRAPAPEWLAPMKAVLTEERFSSDEWTYERKLDGIRCLAFKRDRKVRLFSRTQLDLRSPVCGDLLRAPTRRHA
jgi:ATP-dependent DNA ligase